MTTICIYLLITEVHSSNGNYHSSVYYAFLHQQFTHEESMTLQLLESRSKRCSALKQLNRAKALLQQLYWNFLKLQNSFAQSLLIAEGAPYTAAYTHIDYKYNVVGGSRRRCKIIFLEWVTFFMPVQPPLPLEVALVYDQYFTVLCTALDVLSIESSDVHLPV
jgi:hypothetical protein